MNEKRRRLPWPEAVSDGLTLPCGECGIVPRFDYRVDDETWRKVAPTEHRLSVICLPCFDRLAVAAGVVHDYLIDVQFVGEGRTWQLDNRRMYVWSDYRRLTY